MCKKIVLFFISYYSCILLIYSQDRPVQVMGWPKDAFTMEPLIDSTVVELLTSDSIVIAMTQPEWDERYRPNSSFSIQVPSRSGRYIIRVSNPKYDTLEETFTLKLGKRENIYSLGVLKMRLTPVKEIEIPGVAVTASKIKFYTRGDTLIYNADAFNLAEGSMLDVLIGELPGAELKRDGKIYINGKLVESLLLNGKDFFKSNNRVLLDNLPAYTVDKIKSYNKQSDISKMLGHQVDEGQIVLDVDLKRKYKVGWLGNAEVGSGSEERWSARLFALRFTPQSRISFFGNTNNVNETRKPGSNGEWSLEDIGRGLSTKKMGGADYMVEDKYRRFELSGELGVTFSDYMEETTLSTEKFIASNRLFSRQWFALNDKTTAVNTAHKFRFNLGPQRSINDLQLTVKPFFSYQNSHKTTNNLTAEFTKDLIMYSGLKDSLLQSVTDKELLGCFLNKVRNELLANSSSFNGGMNADLSMKVPRTPDVLNLYAGFDISSHKSETFDSYKLDYASASDKRKHYFDLPTKSFNVNTGIGYMRGLDPEWIWMISPQIDYIHHHSTANNMIHRLDWLEEMSDAGLGVLPSTVDELAASLDMNNSYVTTIIKDEVSISAGGRWDKKKRENGRYISRWRFTWKPTLRILNESFGFKKITTVNSKRTEFCPSLHLELLRNTNRMMHEIEVSADYRQSLASMFNMLGERFDSDPLNIWEGNEDLHKTQIYSLKVRYTSDQWLREAGKRLSANVSANFYKNAVVMSSIYDYTTGVRTSSPKNVNGNWNAELNVLYNSPVDKKRFINCNIGLSDVYYHSVSLVGIENSGGIRKQTVSTNYLQLPVDVNFKFNKSKVGVKVKMIWHHAESKQPNFETIDAANMSYSIYGHVQMPFNFQIASDVTYYTRFGYSDDLINTRNWVWNAQVTKNAVKGRLMFTLLGFDILKQLSNISYTLNSQGRTESVYNVIPRYFMLKVTFRFHKEAKQREKPINI